MGIGGRFTKAELLRYALSFALGKVKFMDRKLKAYAISEPERMQIAEDTIKELRREGRWKDLDDELEPQVGMWGPSKPKGAEGN